MRIEVDLSTMNGDEFPPKSPKTTFEGNLTQFLDSQVELISELIG